MFSLHRGANTYFEYIKIFFNLHCFDCKLINASLSVFSVCPNIQ